MKTGNLEYSRKFYTLFSECQNGLIKDYQIKFSSKLDDKSIFTEIVRIEKDNGYHEKSKDFDYWFYLRNDTNWKRCSKTGLAITNKKFVVEGNISQSIKLTTKNHKGKDFENPKHLVLLQFSVDLKTIVVDIFKDFYPRDHKLIELIIKDHYFVFNDTYKTFSIN